MIIREKESNFAWNRLIRAMAVVLTTLGAPAALHAQKDSMVKISLPPANKIMDDGTVKVSIHLSVPAEPASLRVTAGNQEITDLFGSSRCYKAPCDLEAQLNGNVVGSGWNYLHASVEGPNASADADSAQFFDDHGISPLDATTGCAPSFAVHMHATSAKGLEVDYAPGVGITPIDPERNKN